MMLSTVGRGGDGQKIRDEILNIMHRNKVGVHGWAAASSRCPHTALPGARWTPAEPDTPRAPVVFVARLLPCCAAPLP